MDFIKTEVEFLGTTPSTEEEILTMIERAGRTCYKSEDKITPTSYKAFFRMMLKSKHLSVIEHSNIVIKVIDGSKLLPYIYGSSYKGHFNIYKYNNYIYIAANLRAWFMFFVENINYNGLDGIEIITPFLSVFNNNYPFIMETFIDSIEDINLPTEYMQAISTTEPIEDVELVHVEEQIDVLVNTNRVADLPMFIFKVLTNRGVSHEIVRHRTLQFSQESTRYVNYNKRIGLRFFKDLELFKEPEVLEKVTTLYSNIETLYNSLVDEPINLSPQIARAILPNSLMTEIIVSGRLGDGGQIGDYKLYTGFTNFIYQRLSKQAHPDIRIVALHFYNTFNSLFKLSE